MEVMFCDRIMLYKLSDLFHTLAKWNFFSTLKSTHMKFLAKFLILIFAEVFLSSTLWNIQKNVNLMSYGTN